MPHAFKKLFTIMVFYKSVGQTENGLEHSFVKHWLNAIIPCMFLYPYLGPVLSSPFKPQC